MPPNSDRLPIALVEDDVLYRDYLSIVLASTGRYQVVAQATSAEEALDWGKNISFAAVLVDIRLPGRPGPALVAQLLARNPALHAIMLTAHEDADHILESFRAGASGYIVKGVASTEIIEALDDAFEGGAPMSRSIAQQVLALLRRPAASAVAAVPPPSDLTPRETDVITLVANGFSDKEAADELGVSRSAIKNHLANIYTKWRVRSRTEAAVRFVQSRAPGNRPS